MQVVKGGSAGKNTDVPGSDIDLIVISPDFDHTRIRSYRDKATCWLKRSGGVERVDRLRDTKVGVCVKVITSNDERQLDILFTGDPDENSHKNPQSGYTCFHALAECKHVKQMKAKFPEMHDVIIEFKISVRKARDLLSPQINRGVRLPSYFLELLIIKDFKENVPTDRAATVYRRQKSVHELKCPITLGMPKPRAHFSRKSRRVWNSLTL